MIWLSEEQAKKLLGKNWQKFKKAYNKALPSIIAEHCDELHRITRIRFDSNVPKSVGDMRKFIQEHDDTMRTVDDYCTRIILT